MILSWRGNAGFLGRVWDGGSFRITQALPSPFGSLRQAQRCLASLGSNLNAASHLHSTYNMQITELFVIGEFTWDGGSCRMTQALPSPFGSLRQAQRCLASLGSNLNAASHLHSTYNMQMTELFLIGEFTWDGGSCRIRTCDQLIKSQLLYQLS